MPRPGITYQAVATAAAQLLEQGNNPTVVLVRHVLGTGSSTTIANYLRQWKSNQIASALIAAKENIPSELIDTVKDLWEKMLNQSQEKILQLEAHYQQVIAELENEVEKYKKNNQRWQKLFNQWQQEQSIKKRTPEFAL